MVPLLFLAVGGLLLVMWLAAPRGVPWAHELERRNPGAGSRSEWLAPPAVARAVQRDYLATQAWLAECAHHWGMLASELERHTAGAYQRRQQAALAQLVHSPGPRLAGTLTARHQLAVRHFSSDGLRCLLVDRQTERTLTTSHYWTGRVASRQRLPDADLVFQMVYDLGERRWKIERLIQRLPIAAPSAVRVAIMAKLPPAGGRDG